MSDTRAPRPGEVEIDLPQDFNAGVYYIGRIRTPWTTTSQCPKNSAARRDVVGRVEIEPRYRAGLKDLDLLSHVILLYWLDRSRRDFIIQAPSHAPAPRGVFALRSPVRPNPIGLSVVELVEVTQSGFSMRNIDCVDGTPLIDVKPYFASTDSYPEARRP